MAYLYELLCHRGVTIQAFSQMTGWLTSGVNVTGAANLSGSVGPRLNGHGQAPAKR
jgi:hypothetical protein